MGITRYCNRTGRWNRATPLSLRRRVFHQSGQQPVDEQSDNGGQTTDFISLLSEIRETRLSECRFYQKITDIYVTNLRCDDYKMLAFG
jgi:hypothetical protein